MELSISSSKVLQEEFIRTKIKLSEIEAKLKKGYNFSPNYKEFTGKRITVDEIHKFEKSPGEFEASSDESEDSPEITIHSVVKNANNQSKKHIIRGQNVNPKVESRNRRILRMLQGTLLKFKDDSQKRKPQDLKRVQIEQKLETAATEESEKQKELRKDLLRKRKKKQFHLNCVEEMINVTETFESWENNQNNLLNFIISETVPPICFLPSSHSSRSKRQHEKSKMKILDSILKRKIQLDEELADIKQSHFKANEYSESHTDDRAVIGKMTLNS